MVSSATSPKPEKTSHKTSTDDLEVLQLIWLLKTKVKHRKHIYLKLYLQEHSSVLPFDSLMLSIWINVAEEATDCWSSSIKDVKLLPCTISLYLLQHSLTSSIVFRTDSKTNCSTPNDQRIGESLPIKSMGQFWSEQTMDSKFGLNLIKLSCSSLIKSSSLLVVSSVLYEPTISFSNLTLFWNDSISKKVLLFRSASFSSWYAKSGLSL